MKTFKLILILFTIFVFSTFSYSYEKIENPDKSYICIPNEIDENEIKILVLFHGYVDNTNNLNYKKYNDMNFEKEESNWKFKVNKENFFVVGFDLDYKSICSETADDILHNRIKKKIDEIHLEYKPLVLKVYVGGTQYGGAMALYFNLKYDTFDACLCMNGAEILPVAKKYIHNAKNKNFYFYHGAKNKFISISKLNTIAKKLKKEGAYVYVKTYPDISHSLTSTVYSDAINKLLKDKK